MPIRREHRYFYPIDWKQLSAVIRFVRARGRCEGCGRPHMQDLQHTDSNVCPTRLSDNFGSDWRLAFSAAVETETLLKHPTGALNRYQGRSLMAQKRRRNTAYGIIGENDGFHP